MSGAEEDVMMPVVVSLKAHTDVIAVTPRELHHARRHPAHPCCLLSYPATHAPQKKIFFSPENPRPATVSAHHLRLRPAAAGAGGGDPLGHGGAGHFGRHADRRGKVPLLSASG